MQDNDSFKYRVARVLSNQTPPRDRVLVCDTPDIIRNIGFNGNCIVMEPNKIRACLASEDLSGKEHRHDLPIDFMDDLPRYIEKPAMILQSMSQSDSVVLVTDCKDKRGDPIVIALNDCGKLGNIEGEVVRYTKLASTYGKQNFSDFLRRSLQNNGLLYFDIKKSRDLAVSAGLQLPGVLANLDSIAIIRRYNENVNTFKRKFLLNPKNYEPEKYGQTLYRSDGLPFAYADPDGRQKQYEYGKGADGTPFVTKTNMTFSDGRTEITEYNARGQITLLERMTADGKKSYSYSSDGYFRSSERSTELYDSDDYFARKSVHEKTREKQEERGYYHDNTKESWCDYEEHGSITLSKHNVYGDGERLYNSSEVKYAYDRYGNVVSAIYDDGSVYKTEYYPPSVVRDLYKSHGWSDEDIYDAEIVTNDKVKTETARHADGSMHIKQYTIEGECNESDYSPDGTLTRFRNENGETFRGKAAELALLKAHGQAPTAAEVKANGARRSQQEKTKSVKATAKVGSGKRGGSGSGAGR